MTSKDHINVCAEKDNQHGHFHAAPQKNGLQHVVDDTDENAPDHEVTQRSGINSPLLPDVIQFTTVLNSLKTLVTR